MMDHIKTLNAINDLFTDMGHVRARVTRFKFLWKSIKEQSQADMANLIRRSGAGADASRGSTYLLMEESFREALGQVEQEWELIKKAVENTDEEIERTKDTIGFPSPGR